MWRSCWSPPQRARQEQSAQGSVLSATGSSGQIYAKTEGTTTIKASWGKLWGASDLNVSRASLVSIAVTPADAKVVKGSTQQFTAMGTFSDATTQDITKGGPLDLLEHRGGFHQQHDRIPGAGLDRWPQVPRP